MVGAVIGAVAGTTFGAAGAVIGAVAGTTSGDAFGATPGTTAPNS